MANIMVGYDGSNCAKAAIRLAIEHATAFKGKVHVVTSVSDANGKNFEKLEQAESQLQWAKNQFNSKGIQCEVHLLVRRFSSGKDIVTFAIENEISEIIVGVLKRSKLEKLIMGSTAQYVILKAPCPVVTVKYEKRN